MQYRVRLCPVEWLPALALAEGGIENRLLEVDLVAVELLDELLVTQRLELAQSLHLLLRLLALVKVVVRYLVGQLLETTNQEVPQVATESLLT